MRACDIAAESLECQISIMFPRRSICQRLHTFVNRGDEAAGFLATSRARLSTWDTSHDLVEVLKLVQDYP